MPNKTLDSFFARLRSTPEYRIEVGIISGYSEDRKTKEEKKGLSPEEKKSKKRTGVTNAEILFINENGSPPRPAKNLLEYEKGSPARHIPPRPVLHLTIQDAKKTMILPAVKLGIKRYARSGNVADMDKTMQALASEMQDHAREIIKNKDRRLRPNAKSTQRQKFRKLPAAEQRKIIKAGGAPLINYPLHDTGQLERSIVAREVRINKTTTEE